MQKYIILLCFFLSSCGYFYGGTKTQTLYFDGPADKEAMLYKIQKNNTNQRKLISVQKLATNSQNIFSVGDYLIVNECSAYEFQLENEPIHIRLNPFHIKLLNAEQQNKNSNQNHTEVQCINRTTNEKVAFINRNEFYILPGQNIITIAGKKFLFKANANESKNFVVTLNPLTILSPIEGDQTQYFMQPVQQVPSSSDAEHTNSLNVAYVNEPVWLNPGKYAIEINGTKSIVTVEPNESQQVKLGSLRIAQPKNFPLSERGKSPNQPIFAYINKKILFSLDKDYAVFPNKYSVNLDNSDMQQIVEVNENMSSKIQTYGVQINPPPCPAHSPNCVFSQKIFIHAKDQPFILTKVSMGVPFLVFQGEYQYSAEGADGIKKNLSPSYDSIKVEHMAQLKLNWKLQVSSNNLETRKIYIEPTCCGVTGKSEDLNAYRPREVLLPEGEYRVNSFVRQEKNILKRNSVAIRILPKQPNEVYIPIYASNKNNAIFLQETEDEDTPQEQTNLTPIAQ